MGLLLAQVVSTAPAQPGNGSLIIDVGPVQPESAF